MERSDTVVVGAGVMGTAAARALARRGVGTILLEQFRLGHGRGSSHGATRIFRLSYPHPDYVRLAQRALGEWRRLEEEAGEPLLVSTGGIDVGPVDEDCAAALEAAGAAHRWLTAQEAGERFPMISFDGFDRALYQPDGGVSLAGRTVAAQARVAAAAGAEVREEVEVLRLSSRPEGGVVVETSAGEIRAGVVVVTAGPWAGRVLAEHLGPAAGQILTPTLQLITYFEPREAGGTDGMPTLVEWTGPTLAWYAVPMAGDAPGVKSGDHLVGPVVDPREGPFPVQGEGLAPIVEHVARRLPGVVPEPVASETCLYTITPDEDFILDRIGDVVVGAGFSGHGFKFAPLIGEVLADLATGGDPGLPAGRFAASRLALR